jgi:hypothetical protein
MLLIIVLSTIAIAWVGVLAVFFGACLSAAAGDRALPRRGHVRQSGSAPVRHLRLVS